MVEPSKTGWETQQPWETNLRVAVLYRPLPARIGNPGMSSPSHPGDDLWASKVRFCGQHVLEISAELRESSVTLATLISPT